MPPRAASRVSPCPASPAPNEVNGLGRRNPLLDARPHPGPKEQIPPSLKDQDVLGAEDREMSERKDQRTPIPPDNTVLEEVFETAASVNELIEATAKAAEKVDGIKSLKARQHLHFAGNHLMIARMFLQEALLRIQEDRRDANPGPGYPTR